MSVPRAERPNVSVKTSTKCAVCWLDPQTGRRGTHETTWICKTCRKGQANTDWSGAPWWEATGVLQGDGELPAGVVMGSATPDRTPDPYATRKCIAIMREHCLGASHREISRRLKCSVGYVSKVVTYWQTQRAGIIEQIKKTLQSNN